MLFKAIAGNNQIQSPGPANDYWYQPISYTNTGVRITAMSAMKASAAYACIKVLSETLASLPRLMYQRAGDKIMPAPQHPLQDVIDMTPNNLQTGFEFWEMQIAFSALFGNSYAEIVSGPRGFVDQLIPLRPDFMRVLRAQDGGVRFEYTDPFTGVKRIYLENELFRIPGFSFNGVEGIAPIFFASDAIGLALATEAFGCKSFSKDATPALVLEHPHTLKPEAIKNIKESWLKANAGLDNAYSVAVLEEGMKVNSIGVKNQDAQFLETRRYQIAEIARYMRIPLHMINELEKSTYSNIEQQSIEFVKYTVRPWMRRIEQRVNTHLVLKPNVFYMKHNIDELLMSETSTRYAAYASGINAGWLTRNEVREKEGLNSLPGLDEPLTPMNMGGDKPGAPAVPKQAPANQSKITDQMYRSVVSDAFDRIISAELNGVTAILKKYSGEAAHIKMESFFNAKHHAYIIKTLTPIKGKSAANIYADNYTSMRIKDNIGNWIGKSVDIAENFYSSIATTLSDYFLEQESENA